MKITCTGISFLTKLETIHKVRTPNYGDLQTPPPPFKQYHDAIKTDVRFCIEPSPSPLKPTYIMDGPNPLEATLPKKDS